MTRFLAAGTVLLLLGAPRLKAAEPTLSVQQQLDALKRGQDEILAELRALRTELAQRPASPRVESAARPTAPAVLNVHGESFKGAPGAKIGLIAYSDFDCSHCAEFATNVFPQIDQKYIATGLVKYFFRDLPEPGSAEALLKAQLARCAGEQGRFWEMHDYLFLARPTLLGSDLANETQAAGLDRERLLACLKTQTDKYPTVIQRSALGATRMGIRGTPTFFLGSLTDDGDIVRVKEMVMGVETFAKFDEVFQGILEEQARASQK